MAAASEPVVEYWEDASLPRDSLSRAAERLKSRGSLYLGGGVGVEAVGTTGQFKVVGGGTHPGALSAVTQALGMAGAKQADGTPGGTTKVTDPAIAARLFELDSQENDCNGTIARLKRTLARNQKDPQYSPFTTPGGDDLRWEQRRINEMTEQLKQIKQERAKLLAAKTEAKMQEAVEVGKPGTNWKQVTPENRKKVSPLVKHWMGKAHPWQSCVDELAPEKGRDAAKRICSVVKDMGMKTTKWRKGGKKAKVQAALVEEFTGRLLEAAGGDADVIQMLLLRRILEDEAPKAPKDGMPGSETDAQRARRLRRGARREAVLGRTDAGSVGDVDLPDAAVGEAVFAAD